MGHVKAFKRGLERIMSSLCSRGPEGSLELLEEVYNKGIHASKNLRVILQNGILIQAVSLILSSVARLVHLVDGLKKGRREEKKKEKMEMEEKKGESSSEIDANWDDEPREKTKEKKISKKAFGKPKRPILS